MPEELEGGGGGGGAGSAVGLGTIEGRARVLGLHLMAGADAATASIYDSLDDSGAAVVTVQAPANGSRTIWFGPSGIRFNTGMSATVTGTDPAFQAVIDENG